MKGHSKIQLYKQDYLAKIYLRYETNKAIRRWINKQVLHLNIKANFTRFPSMSRVFKMDDLTII